MRRTTDRRNAGRLVVLSSLVALVLLIGLAGCGEGGTEVGTSATAPSTTAPLPPIEGDARQQLEAARVRWAASGIDSYELAWTRVCYCPRDSGWVRVVDGEVVDAWFQAAGTTEQGPATTTTESEPGSDPAEPVPTPGTVPGTAPGAAPGTPLAPDPTDAGKAVPAGPGPSIPTAGVPESTIPAAPETTVPDESVRPGSVEDPDTPSDGPTEVLTVEGIFDEIQAALDEGADAVTVDYDPETGRPLRVDVDWITNAVDDEMGIRVDSFTILTDGDPDPVTPEPSITGTSLPPEVREVATADLSVHHGCGHGFFVGNAEQTVALHLSWVPNPGPNAGMLARPEPGPTPLPGRDWTGELRLGTNLFANWCDDVLEPGEPTPEVAQGWPVVGGTLEMTADPSPDGGCGSGSPARARVTDLQVEAANGSIVGLPDLEVENDAWGCIAG